MTGIYHHSIDAKGRLFIPARLREELGDVFYVTLSMEKCLSGYSLESWGRREEKVKSMTKAQQIKARPFFANANKCDLDGQGRILLPKLLRDRVGLENNVTIVGSGECIEFWDSETYAPVYAAETSPENIALLFAELDL